MPHRHVDVTMGSPRFRHLEAGAMRITRAWFPPHCYLEPHTHASALFSTMLGGSFDTEIAARRLDCLPGTVWTEPVAETHANRAGKTGAHVLCVQLDPRADDLTGVAPALFDEPATFTDPMLALEARNMAREFDQTDVLSPLALESRAFGMFVVATRAWHRERRAPAWLARVRDCLRADFVRPPSVGSLAAEAGVHPSHLCHTFRERFGVSVGEYARAVRLDHALSRLAHTDAPISEIALSSGYSDQAHFTRACRRATGTPPAAYRRAHSLGG